MTMRRTEVGRAMQTYAAGRATGPRALVVAIIGYAARDALDGDAAAAGFLLSPAYRHYLELVGLPPEWLPAGVTRADLAGQVERAALDQGRGDVAKCRIMSQVNHATCNADYSKLRTNTRTGPGARPATSGPDGDGGGGRGRRGT